MDATRSWGETSAAHGNAHQQLARGRFARLEVLSRSRITQILNSRNLAPVLQERILALSQSEPQEQKLTEGALRQMSGLMDWREQISRFDELWARSAVSKR